MKFSNKQKQLLYFELAKFVRSGFGFENACEALLDQPGVPADHRTFCKYVLEGIKNKKTVGQSIADLPLNISPLEINMIQAGESAGLLEKSFEHLEKHFKLIVETRKKIIKGLTYPLLLLHVGAVFGLVAIGVITAWNPEVQEGAIRENIQKGLIGIVCIYLVAGALLIWFVWLNRRAKTYPTPDRLLNKVPLLGSMRKNLALARFCEVFHMCLKSAQKIDQCLINAGSSSTSGLIYQAAKKGAESVKKGETLNQALMNQGSVFPADFIRSVGNAEMAGVLDEDFMRWLEYYRQSAVESVERVAEWVPKIFYWGVLAAVAFIIIRMALAYQQLIQGVLSWGDRF